MSARTLVVVALALVCGLLAAAGVAMMGRSGPAVPGRPVVFATADIEQGETIAESSLEVVVVPADRAPAGAAEAVAAVAGQVARIPMLKGEAVVGPKLAEKGVGSSMAALVPPGMRAVTIAISAGQGGVSPGDAVDVHLTRNGPPRAGESHSATLLQNVAVLAVDSRLKADPAEKSEPAGARSVTLLVAPGDDAKLSQGQAEGTFHLSLRNPKDSVVVPPPPPAPPTPVVAGLLAKVRPGMVAFTIEAPGVSTSLAGLLEPGHRVDVLGTLRDLPGDPAARGKGSTTLLVAGAEILAVNGSLDPQGGNFRGVAAGAAPGGPSVTLLVSLVDAATLSRAQTAGVIHLVLNGPGPPGPGRLARGVAPRIPATAIPPGKRACTVAIAPRSASRSVLMLPGTRVDVHRDAPGGRPEPIVQDALVLAVNDTTDAEAVEAIAPDDLRSATILVSTDELAEVGVEASKGALLLSPRNPADRAIVAGRAAPPPAPTRTTWETRTLRGASPGWTRFAGSR